MTRDHSVILVNNTVDTKNLVAHLIAGRHPDFAWLAQKRIEEFSQRHVEQYIEEEERHDQKVLSKGTGQSLRSMSSGERKKALLRFIRHQNPEVLLVVNPYDSLDVQSQDMLKCDFEKMIQQITIIQIINRISDTFPFVKHFYVCQGTALQRHSSLEHIKIIWSSEKKSMHQRIPEPLQPIPFGLKNLVALKDVSVSFNGKTVLSNIRWNIQKGEFWQLKGPNGSGKSTLLSLITGDSHKGYGQDLTLFGYKKGNGESVWDIKGMIGYFSPAMVDRFRGYHTLKQMLISGLHDSVGLYTKPSEIEKQKAMEWLHYLGLKHKKEHYFHELSIGAKRMIMTARAMIKHPPLLILDEPTVGLDDGSASFFVELINAYAQQSDSAIIFVSHRHEAGLRPNTIFELTPTDEGSKGFCSFG